MRRLILLSLSFLLLTACKICFIVVIPQQKETKISESTDKNYVPITTPSPSWKWDNNTFFNAVAVYGCRTNFQNVKPFDKKDTL